VKNLGKAYKLFSVDKSFSDLWVGRQAAAASLLPARCDILKFCRKAFI